MEKWFALEASCPYLSTPEHCETLMTHPAFDSNNPNKLRSVISVFASLNTRMFHADDGSGYRFLAHHIAEIDKRNPQISARMVLPLTRFGCYDEDRQAMMKGALIRLKTAQGLSSDLSEVVDKTIG
jgi:aminopeptidase N